MTNTPSAQPPARGMRAIAQDNFNTWEAVGGVRGLIEATAPGLVYLIVFVVTQQLTPALIGSLGLALVFVGIRLAQRTPVTLAFSGVFGVAIGVFAAWRSGSAGDFYVWGLVVNLSYAVALAVSLIVRWPGVGVLVELFKSGFSDQAARAKAGEDISWRQLFDTSWRNDSDLMKRYTIATWLWIAMFLARLGVQAPLYFAGDDAVGALGTARLVMGVPLFALVLWLTWRLIHRTPAPNEVDQQSRQDL